MYAIATLANKNALYDLKVFLFTLQLWNETLPNLYIYCDSHIETFLKTCGYKGKLVFKNVLDVYNGYDRKTMESMNGKNHSTLFGDFVFEKTYLLDWVFEFESNILFCDADICFMGPLFPIDKYIALGVSRHNIRTYDEQKYGMYNAGFLYVSDKSIPAFWRSLSKTSHFFEQSCIEDLVKEYCDSYIVFPNNVNYGWWRLVQGRDNVENLKKCWSIKREKDSCGITIDSLPLQSIHTHWKTNDMATSYFNKFVLDFLEKLKSVEKTKKLLNYLSKNS